VTNDELIAAWRRKLPNVEPTDRELSAFALGIEAAVEVTDEMVETALEAWDQREPGADASAMRAALRAAMGAR